MTPNPPAKCLVSFIDDAPSYEIVMDTAWDHLQFTEHEAALARACDAVSFGSLSQRHPVAHGSRPKLFSLKPNRHAQDFRRQPPHGSVHGGDSW